MSLWKLLLNGVKKLLKFILPLPSRSQPTFLGLPVQPYRFVTVGTSKQKGKQLVIKPVRVKSSVGKYTETQLQLPEGALPLEMVAIPGGHFMMGITPEEKKHLIKLQWRTVDNEYYSVEEPLHSVIVPDFFMGMYAVTQAQYQAIMGINPTEGRALIWNPEMQEYIPDAQISDKFVGINQPVMGVSWEDTQVFLQRLNQLTGRTYRLPTEAEWEYAAKAGTTAAPYGYGNGITTNLANYLPEILGEIDRRVTIAVNELYPNPWGLFHIHGNVYEWCHDEFYAGYQQKPERLQQDGSIPWTEQNTGMPATDYPNFTRISRGGSWLSNTRNIRSASRAWFNQDVRDFGNGFRLVLLGEGAS